MVHKKIIIKRFLSEHSAPILSTIADNNLHTILLHSPTGSGKTHLLADIYEHSREMKWTMVVVSPNVANIKQEESTTGIEGLCERKYYTGSDRVITTPDKLPQVIQTLRSNNQPYMLVIDEAHERYCNTLRYEAFSNITLSEGQAEKVIYMSATPEPIPFNLFDAVVEVNREENTSIDFNVRECNKVNNETFLDQVLKAKQDHKQVVAFINDKKAISSIVETLKQTHPELKVGFMNSHTKENEIYKTIVDECKLLDTYDIVFTTEVIKAGVNINHYEKDLALVIRGKDLIQIDLIQFVARFRSGVKDVIALFTTPQDATATKSRQTILNELRKDAETLLKVIDKLSNKNNDLLRHLENDYGIIRNADTGKYIIDEVLLICAAEKLYNTELKKNLYLYAKTLRETNAIKFNVTMSNEHEIAQNDVLRANLKAVKERLREEQQSALEYINGQSKYIQELTFTDGLDLKLDQHQELYDALQTFKESGEYKLLAKASKALYKGNMYSAYKELCEIGKEGLELKYKEYIAKEINKVYASDKEHWIEFIKTNKRDNLITELSRLRILCDELEFTRGTTITRSKLLQVLAQSINKGHMKNITLDDLAEGQKNKKVQRASAKLLKNLHLLCCLSECAKGFKLSSYK